MSTMTHAGLPRALRPIPVRLPAWPLRAWADVAARWRAHRLQRADARVLEGLSEATRRDIGAPSDALPGRHDPTVRLLNRVGLL